MKPHYCLLALVLTCPAFAGTVLYNNIGDPFLTNFALNSSTTEYQSFSSGSTSLVFNDLMLELDLYNGQQAGAGSINVYLYSDSSNAPGSSLGLLGTIEDSSLAVAPQAINLTVNYTLAANTRYWIGITPSNSVAAWEQSTVAGGDTGVSGQYEDVHGSVYPVNSNSAFQMTVTASPASSTPEPSSALLLGAGLAAGAALLRMTRR